MAHQHHHHHASAADVVGNRRRLGMALMLTATYMVAEVIGGLAANSLALLADAGHMFSDAAALGLSLVAVIPRPAPSNRAANVWISPGGDPCGACEWRRASHPRRN